MSDRQHINSQKNPPEHDGITFEVIEPAGDKPTLTKGVYLIPNLITTLSLFAGFYSIILSANGEFYRAALAIFASAFLDGMDGRAARLLNAQSPFGEQYDSLADCVAFGLAPAMLVYSFALQPLGRFGVACAFVYVACAAFRLARFNVQIGTVDKKYFIGLASPLAALLLTCAVLVSLKYVQADHHADALTWFFASWVIACGLLMVSNIRYYSFKEFDKQKVPFVVLLLAVLLFGIVLYDVPVGLLAIGVAYVLSGLVTTFYKS
ncbi:CDP-diacylglycerol--serine O-phosphatidyltransferase [Moraxella cuniculi DSM 21768]|uniref:CDP-diacylglycerol--serine O-phosphatidyltransferase n=2 Tax=Moraxella cuniculi TaxID=34061 RepID=A0A1N7E1M5_9GAMM|nr:CDP-diacylglycerol--serine O-phosphatidyltransferase [Moraxella cuniculi]OOS04613.1 CDP-diacylglycerol--serine O-phosphatidyltransferase [Moraxella cuniculi]SIR82007.1 CDP-diacylglycerol--serine O-phosphatidyltransferase [Moraxella cuniculi DSM 21768]VEG12917.1 CDP-diacylglycerol-serine O-phosphatidyltransferase [Moraxella cuniculi]